MVAIAYRVLYQVRAKGVDTKSGKKLSNLYYFRSGVSSAGVPPAYGDPIVGSSLATFLTNFKSLWNTNILPLLSVNYTQQGMECRKIVGWKYGSPRSPIIGAVSTLTGTAFTIAGVMPFSTPKFGFIQGLVGASAANGIWTITPTSTNTFTTNAITAGDPWISGGTMQEVGTSEGWDYTDLATVTATASGARTGEALPLFSDVSARRLGSTSGKKWQGRNSYAPIAETDALNGKIEATALTNWQAGLLLFNTTVANGAAVGDDTDNMFFYNVSFKEALTLQPPFSSANTFTSLVTSQFAQPNMGSLTKRKPRLTSTIT